MTAMDRSVNGRRRANNGVSAVAQDCEGGARRAARPRVSMSRGVATSTAENQRVERVRRSDQHALQHRTAGFPAGQSPRRSTAPRETGQVQVARGPSATASTAPSSRDGLLQSWTDDERDGCREGRRARDAYWCLLNDRVDTTRPIATWSMRRGVAGDRSLVRSDDTGDGRDRGGEELPAEYEGR